MTIERLFHPVIIYIPEERASLLAADVLTKEGFDVVRTSSKIDLELHVPFGKVVVTVTWKIVEVREVCSLPVVNIQAFVLPADIWSQPSLPGKFDRQAFLERVRTGLESEPVRH